MRARLIHYNAKNSIKVEENYIVDNYLGKSENLGYSVVRTHLNGTHPLMKNTKSNRTYYFLNGYGKFKVEDELFEVNEGDTLTIEKDTIYSFEGHFDALLISCPAFNSEDDVIYRN